MLKLKYPVVPLLRRNIEADDTLLQARASGSEISLGWNEVTAYQGDWVTLDGTSKKAILATEDTPLAWAVWAGKDRSDTGVAGLTVIQGNYLAEDDRFAVRTVNNDVIVYTLGMPLAVGTGRLEDGGDDIAGLLIPAAATEWYVAILEELAHDVSTDHPNGFITYNTMSTGVVKA
jgi:hypothetical protein